MQVHVNTLTEPRLSLHKFWIRRHDVFSMPWTKVVSRPMGAILAYLAYQMRLRPNHVTLLSLAVHTLGAVGYLYLPSTFNVSLGLLLGLQLAFALDCADGQLARATGAGTALGKWLDIACDLVSTLTIPLAMAAYGAAQSTGTWGVAYMVGGIALAYSRALLLFTYSIKRIIGIPGATQVSWIRKLYRLANDTAFFLAVIVLVRHWAPAIFVTLFAYAALHLCTACYVAYNMSRMREE